MAAVVLTGCYVVTMDDQRAEYSSGHVVVDGDRIVSVGGGAAPESAARLPGATTIDAGGCVVTPGLVNTHHHLYQWATRGRAVDSTLFGWLTELYPVWARIDEQIVADAATAGLAWLARTGCSTTSDHHYVFPRGGGDVLGATVAAARAVGLRFHPTRGSMDLGVASGGLPPDEVVEDLDTILAATEQAIADFHDPGPGSMLRMGVAPCSPFSVTGELMRAAADLARRHQVRLHTHLAETTDEDRYCAERFGCTPVEYLDSLGWLAGDVWVAHGVVLDDAAIGRLAASRTGVAHCPSSNARLGAGICRTADLVAAGVPVGLGVDGSASNEESSLLGEVRQAVLMARAAGGPQALTVRRSLELATRGGAELLGRADELGSLEPGKLADLALWRLDDLPHAGIADPVAALVLGARPRLELLLVNGEVVVEHDEVITVDEPEAARAATAAAIRLR
ncbi:MAG TPA: 8-oxoguanine deaminase [Streptosporangiaceae bacterium]|nr:8-oxoguanine deaminase [Streptosporangiaceae bacterium]